jgi:hypothetical protein
MDTPQNRQQCGTVRRVLSVPALISRELDHDTQVVLEACGAPSVTNLIRRGVSVVRGDGEWSRDLPVVDVMNGMPCGVVLLCRWVDGWDQVVSGDAVWMCP